MPVSVSTNYGIGKVMCHQPIKGGMEGGRECENIFFKNSNLYIYHISIYHIYLPVSLFRMSEREDQDFFKDSLTWMKGPRLDQESVTVYNFGYDRPLPFPSISLTPDSTLRFNLKTSGMHTQSRGSMVVIGKKYLERFGEILSLVDRIHKDTQALPFAIYVETEDDIKRTNISSHETSSLVRILTSSAQS